MPLLGLVVNVRVYVCVVCCVVFGRERARAYVYRYLIC